MKWIPLAEKNPPVDVEVLVCWADQKDCGQCVAARDGDGDWWGIGLFEDEPTHWMMLPKVPDFALHNRLRDA